MRRLATTCGDGEVGTGGRVSSPDLEASAKSPHDRGLAARDAELLLSLRSASQPSETRRIEAVSGRKTRHRQACLRRTRL